MRPASWTPVVLAALVLALPVSAQVASPLPSVDLGIHELAVHELLVSTRTEEDVWLLGTGQQDSSQRVLRSADAGRSWRVDTKATTALERARLAGSLTTTDLLVWLTPEIGIAAGYLGARVLRTTDAGRSWKSIPLPDAPWVNDVEHLGRRVWLCGSSGRILRSDDAGASWHELKGSPFNDDDRCVSMSFLSLESGWAAGSGSVWATEDGGKSWRRLSAPELQPHTSGGFSTPGSLSRVVRLTPQVAWLQGTGGPFFTADGGKTWQARAEEKKEGRLTVARTAGGQRIITLGPSGDGVPVEQWVPYLGEREDAASLGDGTVVALGSNGLSTFVSGQLLRTGPPVSGGSGVLTPLEGIARKAPDEWLGWTGDQLVASHDEGRTWFRVGRAPQHPLRALVFLKNDTVLAEVGSGALLRSEDFGRTWKPSTSPLDAYDFALASGRSTSPETPFGCVLTSSPASMKLRLEETGCFHHIQGQLSVKLSPGGAELSMESSEAGSPGPVHLEKKTLSRAEGERLVRELVETATHQETSSGCGSTTTYNAHIEWTCPSGPSKEGTVSFFAMGCGPGPGTPAGYSRALSLHRIASEIFELQRREEEPWRNGKRTSP